MNEIPSFSILFSSIQLRDHIGELGQKVIENWLLGLKKTNPALLHMFRDKNTSPYRRLLPWSGEFVGKYLTGCAALYRLLKDQRLKCECLEVIEELLSYQEPNGYLGPFPKEYELTGRSPLPAFLDDKDPEASTDTWDAWGHYHIMTGLLSWYDITGQEVLMDCVKKIAELFLHTFYGDNERRLIDIGWAEMNLAPYHMFVQLYNRTGKEKYLSFAQEMQTDCAEERAGNYLEYAQKGLPFYQCPKPRWESLHVIMGFTEMAKALHQPAYLEAAKQIFYSILSTDVHNTGGFSTAEQAIGNPYGFGAIETCCVVAYNTFALQLYQETSAHEIVDFLEHSLYNAVAGSFSKSGRWSTYNTPMEGFRRANFHDISFQCRPGSPELNCCSVNAHRAIGMLADWAYVEQENSLLLNYYGRAHFNTTQGDDVEIEGDYPFSDTIRIKAKMKNGKKLRLRIPGFASDMILFDTVHFVKKDWYWESDGSDLLSVTLSIPLHFRLQKGEGDCKGRYCIFRGPILLGYDSGENPKLSVEEIPSLSLVLLEKAPVEKKGEGKIEISIPIGTRVVKLHDFYSLGQSGNWYTTWLYENAPNL